MKITVLGRGNAGCLTALHFHYFSQFVKDNIEVELIYDSKTPTLTVGQATTLVLPPLIWQALGTDYYTNSNDLDYTMKTGIMYEDWGKYNDKIFHPFSLGSYALHYDTQKFQNHIINNLDFKVKVVDNYVEDYNKIDSDYIFDCRGWPKDFSNYDKLINPLNAVVCANIEKKDCEVDWTRAVATPDGWCFYIPLYDTVSLGYMYNSEITTKENATKNFKNLFNIDNIRESFPFKQYISKTPIIDERVILNGNMLFFLEPLESTSVATYIYWHRIMWDCLINKRWDTKFATNHIKDYTQKVQNFILWHYADGSKYDSSFWTYAKNLSKDVINDKHFNDILQYSLSKNPSVLRNFEYERNNDLYSQWQPWSFRVWYDGVTKKL